MTTTVDAVMEQENDTAITEPNGRRVIWPDPKKANFNFDRRDPFSTETRHESLKRRHDD